MINLNDEQIGDLYIKLGRLIKENVRLNSTYAELRTERFDLIAQLEVTQERENYLSREMEFLTEQNQKHIARITEELNAAKNSLPVHTVVALIRGYDDIYHNVEECLQKKDKIVAIKTARNELAEKMGYKLGLKSLKLAIEELMQQKASTPAE